MNQANNSSKLTRQLFILLGIIVVAAIAYASIDFLVDQSQSSQPTPTPADIVTNLNPVPLPIQSGESEVLFQDNFDDSIGNWEISPVGQAEYAGGGIILNDNHISGNGWARPHLKFDNTVIDVDCRWLGGAVGGTYGLHFRFQDVNNYYAFYIRNDGWYTIGKMVDGEWQILTENFSPAIDRSGGVNHFHVEATGQNLRFFINNVYLVDVNSTGPVAGDIIFVATKVEGTEQLQVGFDNLVITFYP
jgi:hypothetical protein